MPKKIRFFADTPASEVVKALEQALPTGVRCDREQALALHRQISAVNGTAMDMAKTSHNQGWAYWDLMVLGEETDPELRKVQIAKITDPMMAFRLYLDLTFWTDEEDKLLEVKFKGKLPQAEQELAKGIVKRAKGSK